MNRRDRKWCRCGTPIPQTTRRQPCRYGYCTEWRCKQCGKLRLSAGPVGCKCEGYMRWLWHPGMGRKTPVPLKPSSRKGRRHGKPRNVDRR